MGCFDNYTLGGPRWCEEATSGTVRALATPERAIGRGLRLRERDLFGAENQIAVAQHLDLLGRDHEAVADPTTPLACGVAVSALVDPMIVREEGAGHALGDDDRGQPPSAPDPTLSGSKGPVAQNQPLLRRVRFRVDYLWPFDLLCAVASLYSLFELRSEVNIEINLCRSLAVACAIG